MSGRHQVRRRVGQRNRPSIGRRRTVSFSKVVCTEFQESPAPTEHRTSRELAAMRSVPHPWKWNASHGGVKILDTSRKFVPQVRPKRVFRFSRTELTMPRCGKWTSRGEWWGTGDRAACTTCDSRLRSGTADWSALGRSSLTRGNEPRARHIQLNRSGAPSVWPAFAPTCPTEPSPRYTAIFVGSILYAEVIRPIIGSGHHEYCTLLDKN